jgi:molybdate-binding protein/DNA-binding XRE family transcriptional regulator
VSEPRQRKNGVQALRAERGWTQAELALRAGISRAAVSAIEINRLVPSVAAALALATALGCSVENLFGNPGQPAGAAAWAWPPLQQPCRYWQAEVGRRTWLYPVEATALGALGHDGVCRDGACTASVNIAPERTLVMASCDPAVGLLAAELARTSDYRLIALPRSSREALTLLGQGLVHAAGIHFASGNEPGANSRLVRETLGGGQRLLRAAGWQEGLALAPGAAVRSVRSAVNADLRWVGREAGSAARQCLDELMPSRTPRRLARDHRGVAEAVRCGWADAGVCLRLVSEEAGLRFLGVRDEVYDLCYPVRAEFEPRMQALVRAVRSPSYRRLLAELPGFDASCTGEMLDV